LELSGVRAPAILGACLHLLTHASAPWRELAAAICCGHDVLPFIIYTISHGMANEGEKTALSSDETKDTANTDTDKEGTVTIHETNNEANDLNDKLAQKEASNMATTDKVAKEPKQASSVDENDQEETKEIIENGGEVTVDSDKNEPANKAEDTKTTPSKPIKGEKVKVHFVAVGSAPIMKKTKFQIDADQRFAAVTSFLRKMLKLKGSSLFLYCNSAFVPAPDELVGDLNDCFSVRGELVIHYSLQEAWG
jgi:ubiquitin-like protein ATG12